MSDILHRLNRATTIATSLDDAGTPVRSMTVGYTLSIFLENEDDAPAVAVALSLTEDELLDSGEALVRNWSGVMDGQPVTLFGARRTAKRPDTCCGKCPPIHGGGYDCTCEGNPRCTDQEDQA